MPAPTESARKNKFPKPTYEGILGKDAEPRTELEKCMDALKNGISELEADEDTTIDFAILADAQKQEKMILVCKFRPKDFYQLCYDAGTITSRGVKYKILGAVDCGEVRLKCSEGTFISFFKANKNGLYHVDVLPYNYARVQDEADMEAAKAEKKQAKKHRRQITTSSIQAQVRPRLLRSFPTMKLSKRGRGRRTRRKGKPRKNGEKPSSKKKRKTRLKRRKLLITTRRKIPIRKRVK